MNLFITEAIPFLYCDPVEDISLSCGGDIDQVIMVILFRDGKKSISVLNKLECEFPVSDW